MRVDPYPRFSASMGELVRKLTSLFRDHAQQLNDLTEGKISAVTNAVATQPAIGTWTVGDFVRNSIPAEAGGAGSKYVVLGWIRITDGSANVANTDWLECRALTGN